MSKATSALPAWAVDAADGMVNLSSGGVVTSRNIARALAAAYARGVDEARMVALDVGVDASGKAAKADHYDQNNRAWQERGRYDAANEINNHLRKILGLPTSGIPYMPVIANRAGGA